MSFLGAVAFQWINPKAWVMGLGAVTTYAEPGRLLADVTLMAATFMLINIPCAFSWTAFGQGIKRFLRHGWHLRAFNGVMAALLVASLYPLFLEPLGPPTPGPKSARPPPAAMAGSSAR
jgi:threonine/homoserine/homoserine lactone efflux protein